MLARYPLGFAQWLIALDYALASSRDVALVGEPGSPDMEALIEATFRGYRPHQVVALGKAEGAPPTVPLLEGRKRVDGRATAYVCVEFACQAPVTEPEALRAKLEQR